MKPQQLTTNQKALAVNLDLRYYGTFAEIGAGQEVARYFFQAGGAAGTIAKSMSAYDMKFSDAIYGKSTRYVSKERLQKMLDHEFILLEQRLGEARGADTCFFVFANTVSAKSFKGGNECNGWIGMRFQLTPRGETNDIVLHVRMLDKTNIDQQTALGVVGVNLVYASFFYREDMTRFIESFEDNIGVERIEVDMFECHGPDFKHVNNRILSLKLVEQGLTQAVMFGPNDAILQPSEALYKKAVLVERGSFRPITKVNMDMLECAAAQFLQEPSVQGENVITFLEITMNNLLSTGCNFEDLLTRVDVLNEMGHTVLVSNYSEYFRLSSYIRQYTKNMIGIVLGINLLLEVFNEVYYKTLPGGIMEACGRLFKENTRLYIYPIKGFMYNHYLGRQNKDFVDHLDTKTFAADTLIHAQNLQLQPNLRSLYAYLLENHYIEPITGFNPEYLDLSSKSVFDKVSRREPNWEHLIPHEAAKVIKAKNYWLAKPSAAAPSA